MSSKELNDILFSAQNAMKTMEQDIRLTKNHMEELIKIINTVNEYNQQKLGELLDKIANASEQNNFSGAENRIVFSMKTDLIGKFDMFGLSIHPKFLRKPVNIFNLDTSRGPIFVDNMDVYINDKKSDAMKNALKHIHVYGKTPAYLELDEPEFTLEIVVDRNNLLGNTRFNTIEIAPILAGSFDIKELRIYDIHNQDMATPDCTIKSLNNCPTMRFLLNEPYELLKAQFDIKINYRNKDGKYPFGLHGLYFLDADYDPDSYVIAKIEKKQYIETVSDDIYIKNQYASYKTAATDEGIKYYLSYVNGSLEYEITPSTAKTENVIPRNTKEIYAYVPLKNCSILAMEISKIKTRD